MNSEKQAILNFPRDVKIDVLKTALEQNEIGIFIAISNILLETPITEGGLESEIIESIHQEYLKNL
jgi:hypothetical protein